MRKQIWITSILLLSLTFTNITFSQQERYYFSQDEKIPVVEIENKFGVHFSKEFERDELSKYLNNHIPGLEFSNWVRKNMAIVETHFSGNKHIVKRELENDFEKHEIKAVYPLFQGQKGCRRLLTNEILIRFQENISQDEIDSITALNNLTLIKQKSYYRLYRAPENKDVLKIANSINESNHVIWSYPKFLSELKLNSNPPNDPYFNNQFYLHNTGQIFNPVEEHSGKSDADIDALEAWQLTKGNDNIIIAVLDEGVTSDHPDLPNSRQVRLAGSNFADPDYPDNPSPIYLAYNNNHGNGCAGIIAASQNNNEGITGIAPNCKIMPVKIIDRWENLVDPTVVADAINFAVQNGADILSCSWSYDTDNPNYEPVIRDAIQNAINNNCVVIYSTGNYANHINEKKGYIGFPGNVEIDGVFTVGASDRQDLQANYSPTSDPESDKNQIVDIVAPSNRAVPSRIPGETVEVFSLDIPDDAGFNPYPSNAPYHNPPETGEVFPDFGSNHLDYTGRFGGTSASAPQVSGVAALVLSINNTFTPQEVFEIITQTADEVGPYSYSEGRSKEFGYGRLNANKAVLEAIERTTYISGPETVCSGSATFTIHDNPPGVSVNWSHSSNFNYVSGQGTETYTVEVTGNSVTGPDWIKATITSGSAVATIQKDVYLNPPSVDLEIGVPYEPIGGNAEFVAWASGLAADITDYEWSVIGGTIAEDNNDEIVINPTCCTRGGLKDPGISIDVTGSNTCGTYYASRIVSVDCDDGGINPLSVYPNPSDDMLTVSVEETGSTSGTSATHSAEEGKQPAVYEYYLYDINHRLRKEFKTQKRTVQINTTDLKEGFYILHVVKGDKTWKAKVEIRH